MGSGIGKSMSANTIGDFKVAKSVGATPRLGRPPSGLIPPRSPWRIFRSQGGWSAGYVRLHGAKPLRVLGRNNWVLRCEELRIVEGRLGRAIPAGNPQNIQTILIQGSRRVAGVRRHLAQPAWRPKRRATVSPLALWSPRPRFSRSEMIF